MASANNENKVLMQEYDVSKKEGQQIVPYAGFMCGILCENGGICGWGCAHGVGTFCGQGCGKG